MQPQPTLIEQLSSPHPEPAKILFEERLSDSPFVERIWTSRSERAGTFISLATIHWEMVVSRHQGGISLVVRGPETHASRADCPSDGEWVAIRFKLGTFMPLLAARHLLNGATTLPEAAGTSFWLNGAAWQFLTYENADTFVDRLVKSGLVMRDPVVEAVLQGQTADLSLRSAQRRFLYATGLTHGAVRQIERARSATLLLQSGVSILDTVDQIGYFDQPHLTRSLRHFIGRTPLQLLEHSGDEQMSFLYKTAPLC